MQREIVGLFLAALGGVSFLALFAVTRGVLSDWIAHLLRQVFGWGAYLVALTLLAAGALLLWKNLQVKLQLPWQRIIGAEALFVVALAISHMMAATAQEGLSLARKGGGGGYVGWTISYFLVEAIGFIPAFAVLAAAALVSIALILHLSVQGLREAWAHALTELAALRAEFFPRPEQPEGTTSLRPTPTPIPPAREQAPKVTQEPLPLFIETRAPTRRRALRRRKTLPPLDLLEPETSQGIDRAELEEQARIIEETLESLGVPAQVVECRYGPTVTQFGVEPGYIKRHGVESERVRVNRIAALANDLALALAASSVRIEAPVPGRSIIGIEIPNRYPWRVSLRGVMESSEFASLKAPLKIALGRDVAGGPIATDLARMPHLLISGATGSGKSVCINSLVSCLVFNHTPETLRLILIDPKRVELVHFNDLPHLLGPVILDVEQAVAALKWVSSEMDRRYHLFSRAGARNLEAYNRRAASLGEPPLPFLVICIDELAELMLTAAEEIERNVCRIAQLARATGIHLALATQRPSVDVVTGLIKANFPARICFAVTAQVDSRVVLDTPGAEKLLGRGDMLFMAPDSSKLQRAQGCFISDAEIGRLVSFWRDKATAYLWLLDEKVPWEEESAEEQDELFPEALKLVREHQQASVSFLQRRLRIGYPRAARLMDMLERRGIVGGQTGGGRSREILSDDEDDEG